MSKNNSQVAHIWAQDENGSARSSNGNHSCEGGTLYSYSTPIGVFVDSADKSRRVILVTSRTYSQTTSGKHMPALWRAIDYGRGDRLVFVVPCIAQGYAGRGSRIDHAKNLAHLRSALATIEDDARKFRIGTYKTERAAPYGTEHYQDRLSISGRQHDPRFIQDARKAVYGANDYAELFGLEFDYDAARASISRALDIFEAREVDYNSPQAVAKREKAAAKSEERRAARQAREDAARAERQRAEFERQTERRNAWLAGESNGFHGLNPADGRTVLMRVRGDVLETSQGASVPLAHAVRVFAFVKAVRARGEPWERNGRMIRVGHFSVDRIEADGSFRAGCHSFAWSEVERIAAVAGVADVAPSDDAVTVTPGH